MKNLRRFILFSESRLPKYSSVSSCFTYILIVLIHFIGPHSLFGNSIVDCSEYESKLEKVFKRNVNITLEEANKYFEAYKSTDCESALVAYNLIGFAHYNDSNLQKAKEYFLLGEEQFILTKTNKTHYAYNQIFIALVLIVEGNFDSAIYYLAKAGEIAESTNNQELTATVNLNLGLTMSNMGRLNEAEELLNKAASYCATDSIVLGYAFQNLAVVKREQSNFKEAFNYISKSKSIWADLKDSKGLYFLSLIEAKTHFDQSDFSKALETLLEGRQENSKDIKLLHGKNYLLEARIHNELGNLKSEDRALEQALLKGDDLDLEQIEEAVLKLSTSENYDRTNKVLMQLVAKYKNQSAIETRLATNKNQVLDSELAEGESVIEKQLMAIVSLGVLFLGLCLLLFLIKRQQLKITKLNQNLITSNQHIEAQLNILKEKNGELKQFAYVVSHDLKSPLGTIISFASLLDKEIPEGKPKKYLNFISTSAINMSNLITDLLAHAAVDREMNFRYANIYQLVDATISLLNTQIVESGTVFNVDIDRSMMIYCDEIKLCIALQNLISNAIKYSDPERKSIVNISVKQDEDTHVITISDNGIGISKEHQEKIFEMFHRLKIKKISGSGIGLATCLKIIKSHNGTIDVNSKLGDGAIFTITLPKVKM